MITCAKSVKIGLSSFKSVLIGIRPLLEIPWNGEAALSSFKSVLIGIRPLLEIPWNGEAAVLQAKKSSVVT